MRSSTETVLWAGSIVRYHNRPTAQRQTVGEHTWRVLVIYTELWGIPRAEVYQYIIYHDVPEIVTGDVPFMAKRRFPQIKQVLHHIELDHVPKILDLKLPEITMEEKGQIKAADLLEMLFFAVDDYHMGCSFSSDIVLNIMEALEKYEDDKTWGKIWRYITDRGYSRAVDQICINRKIQDPPITNS